MNPLNLNKTHTTKFILPMAFDESEKHNKILTPAFVDTYIATIDNPSLDDKINIVYKKDMILEDQEDTIIKSYDIPDKWADDYVKILAGQYSTLSEQYKQHLLNFWELDKDSFMYAILYRPPEKLKELQKDGERINSKDELWSPPDISEQIYKLGVE